MVLYLDCVKVYVTYYSAGVHVASGSLEGNNTQHSLQRHQSPSESTLELSALWYLMPL